MNIIIAIVLFLVYGIIFTLVGKILVEKFSSKFD